MLIRLRYKAWYRNVKLDFSDIHKFDCNILHQNVIPSGVTRGLSQGGKLS